MTKAVAKRVEETTAVAEAPASETAAIIQMIERAARDPNVDIDKMERLFQMRLNMEAKAAEAAFNTAMAAAQAELVPVVHNARNDQTSSNYANIEALAKVAMPTIHKHGFGLSFGTFKSEIADHQGVTCKVSHASGHSETYKYDVPVDAAGLKGSVNKTKTHAYGSTLTYGRRYATLMAFNIATKDDDDGNAASGSGSITDEQCQAILEKLGDIEGSTEQFCQFFGIEGVAKLPAKKFDLAIQIIDAKKRARSK